MGIRVAARHARRCSVGADIAAKMGIFRRILALQYRLFGSSALAVAFLFASATANLCAVGCAGVKQLPSNASGTGGTGTGGSVGGTSGTQTGVGGTTQMMIPPCPNNVCTDFPTAPIFAVGVQSDAGNMFGAPSGTGPCVTEPEDGTLFPNNWLRPRIRVPGNTGILKITFHSDMEANDLVAYSMGETWALPKDIWTALSTHVREQDITVTVQVPSGGATTVRFQVANVSAGGSMVFWSADPSQVGKQSVESMTQAAVVNDSYLLGFAVGDESTASTLKITDVVQPVTTQNGLTQGSHCIGCHAGTPDGDYVAFVDAWPWGAAFAGIKPGMTGQPLETYPGASCTNWNTCTGSRTYVQYPWMGGIAFSKAHWTAGDQIGVVAAQLPASDLTQPWNTDNKLVGNLVWIDTESSDVTVFNGQPFPTRGTAFDYMAHTGDLGGVAFPTWSNDGNTIVYASSSGTTADQDGRLNQGPTDLYSVPYNNRAGGAATPVPGASTSDYEEYYPAFSPDDRMIAFTRIPKGGVMYANAAAQVYVVPFGSNASQATYLKANDANTPSCPSSTAGVNNHWPKWSPDATLYGERRYYWIIFSSNRYGLPTVTTTFNGTTTIVEVSQLYITAVVTDEINTYTYPAIYLWNQPQNRLNTTPAWQNFHIPIVVD